MNILKDGKEVLLLVPKNFNPKACKQDNRLPSAYFPATNFIKDA